MAGFLDDYGTGDERRERRVKRIVIWGLVVVFVAAFGYFYFRTWPQERVVNAFLASLAKQDFQGAYQIWGCTPEKPCRYYTSDNFIEDWGPSSPHSNGAAAKIDLVDYCDSEVVFDISFPNAPPDSRMVALSVERETDKISFAAWQRCPGRHLQLGQFIHNLFGR
jgi:hypothetical protein